MQIPSRITPQIFQTKKRLFNAPTVHWMMACVVFISIGYLFILTEIVKMHDRHVVFFRVHTGSLPQSTGSSAEAAGVVRLQARTPVFVVSQKTVVLGAVQDLVLPKIKENLALWQKDAFEQSCKEWVSYDSRSAALFPAEAIAVAFDDQASREAPFGALQRIMDCVQSRPGTKTAPTLVFVDLKTP